MTFTSTRRSRSTARSNFPPRPYVSARDRYKADLEDRALADKEASQQREKQKPFKGSAAPSPRTMRVGSTSSGQITVAPLSAAGFARGIACITTPPAET